MTAGWSTAVSTSADASICCCCCCAAGSCGCSSWFWISSFIVIAPPSPAQAVEQRARPRGWPEHVVVDVRPRRTLSVNRAERGLTNAVDHGGAALQHEWLRRGRTGVLCPQRRDLLRCAGDAG